MTVRTPPTFLQSEAHPAENTRLALQGFYGSDTASFSGGVSAFDPVHGVTRKGSTQLAVTQNGTPNMSVNVAAGSCFIRGTQSAAQGCYHFFSDATVNLSIDAADATNARRDLIVAQVRDSGYSGSDNDARLFVVKGTPSGSPADPTVPANSLVLARVTVPAGASTIVTANIADLRTYARPWNTAWGVSAIVERTADRTFNTTSPSQDTTLTLSFTHYVGRRYRVSVVATGKGLTSTTFLAQLDLTDSSATRFQRTSKDVRNTSDFWPFSTSFTYTPGSTGVATWQVRGACSVSSTAWQISATSNQPAQLVVEDLGPI